MNMKRLAFLLPTLCLLHTVAVAAWAQRHDAGLNLTEQSFAYGGDLDALYHFASSSETTPSKSTNDLHVLVKNGKFRMSFMAQGMQFDTIITKDRTLSQQGDVKYNFNKPHPESLTGMPPLPINFESFSFLKVKPESYYILQAGSTHGMVQTNTSGKIPDGTFFDRSYFPAEVALTAKDGLPVVTEIRLGDTANPLRTYRYSEHRKLGSVWLPGRIECQYFKTTPPVTYVYTLKSLRTTVAAASFDYDRTLKKDDLVQSDNGKSVASFAYDPARSLEDQHAAAAAKEKRTDDELAQEQKQRRYNSSTLLIILGVGLTLLWYVRRRMNRGREEAPHPGDRAGV